MTLLHVLYFSMKIINNVWVIVTDQGQVVVQLVTSKKPPYVGPIFRYHCINWSTILF